MISTVHDSPLGPLTLVSDGAALTHLLFDNARVQASDVARGSDQVIDQARRELDAYFAGRLRTFALPVRPHGTAFQERVWSELVKIPYGATRSYGALAAALGAPKASRAVGLANGRNPIAIVIPCHRVIGGNGALTGYGGGIERKRFLLATEQGEPLLRC